MSNDARPLIECKREDLVNNHALVYGRTRIWYHDLSDNHEMTWHWSAYAWWKAMWYSHRGSPCHTSSWGVYGGCGGGGFTGSGDAELSHFLPMPPNPTNEQPENPNA